MSSLYIHIPFCLKRCIYCDFVSGLYGSKEAEHYALALKKELAQIPAHTLFSTLYIGGGTPTALSVSLLEDLTASIFDSLQFSAGYEATIEANPGTLHRDKLTSIRSAGINRISMGVQSFNDEDLAFLGRIHSGNEAEQAVELARSTGFDNVSIDLIYGIPGQNLETWKNTLAKAVDLMPQHISTYELTVEKGTALDTLLQSTARSTSCPDEDQIIEMYEYAIDYLVSRGYDHYEISNFALPRYHCQHNINYWNRGEYYGIGLGAHSFLGNRRFSNTDAFDTYLDTISAGRSPVKEEEIISDERALAEFFYLGLRKTEGINVQSVGTFPGLDIERLFHREIRELREAGLIEIAPPRSLLRLTRKGLSLSNEVFTKFV